MAAEIPPAAPKAITKAAETVSKVAKAVDQATPPGATGPLGQVMAVFGGGSPSSRLTMWAGIAGIGVTLLNTLKDGFFKDQDFSKDLGIAPAGVTIGAGLLMLTAAGKAQGPTATFLRYGAMAPVFGGLAGALIGGWRATMESPTSNQNYDDGRVDPSEFNNVAPTTVEELRGSRLANADVRLKNGTIKDVQVYLDPTNAVKVPDGLYETAVEMARNAARNDKDAAGKYLHRSQAIIQTKDGALWVARLAGDLDQIDGPLYTDGNEHDPLHRPRFRFVQQGVLALVGLEGVAKAPDPPDPRTPPEPPGGNS